MPFMHSPSREGRKRREREASLSPRPSLGIQDRLPSIHDLLPDIPPASTEQALAQLRSPLRQDPTGPTRSSTLPATLSPPPTSRRPQLSAPSSRSRYPADDRNSRSTSYETSSAQQLPIHGGPPLGRAAYSAPSPGPSPVSPYTPSATDTRRYPATAPETGMRSPDPLAYSRNGHSHSLPPPPVSYNSSVNGHVSYNAGRDDRNGGYDDRYYDPRSRVVPAYPPPNSGYGPPPGYAVPPNGGYYPMSPHYQQGYSPGSLQFEQEQIGGQQPRRRRGNLPRDTTDILKAWFSEHLAHPYPTEDEKQMLCNRTGLAMTQISNWFINARRRRIPELVSQAHAETQLRENSGESSSSSDKG